MSKVPFNAGPPAYDEANNAPKKYIKVNGISKLNPEYTQWQQKQTQQAAGQQATTLKNANMALPVISNMEDYMQYNQSNLASGSGERPLAINTFDPSFSKRVGLKSDQLVDGLQAILAKYEVPMGLMAKLLDLQQFDVLEFIIDDSGSMNNITDSYYPNGQPMTRWVEAIQRLKNMIEVVSYIPTNYIRISFLNRQTVIQEARGNVPPHVFANKVYAQLDQEASILPRGTTPAFAALQNSLKSGQGRRVSRYFFGDGVPNHGEQPRIEHLIKNRPFPEQNPITFLSCTNEDDQVEWMKELEEVAPFCSEYDDYSDASEADKICGIPILVKNQADKIKKKMNWEPLYQDFLTKQIAYHFPEVKEFKRKLFHAAKPYANYQETQNLPAQESYGLQYEYAQKPQNFAPINYRSYGKGPYNGGKSDDCVVM
ncbi:MAG: hypothetical protein SGCHY_001162 [Lobulomycetales sp.]